MPWRPCCCEPEQEIIIGALEKAGAETTEDMDDVIEARMDELADDGHLLDEDALMEYCAVWERAKSIYTTCLIIRASDMCCNG